MNKPGRGKNDARRFGPKKLLKKLGRKEKETLERRRRFGSGMPVKSTEEIGMSRRELETRKHYR